MDSEREKQVKLLRKSARHLAIRLFILFILCAIGGFLFRWTEGRRELEYKCGVKKVRRDFLDSLWSAARFMGEDDWKSLGRRRLLKFEDELHTAFDAGINSYSGIKAWSFINSVFYSMTVMTTIGYGHISPVTFLGQFFTVVYALVGIPLFTIVLTDAGKVLTRAIKLWLTRREADRNRFVLDDNYDLPLKLTFGILMAYSSVGTLFFYLWESDWGISSSFYFVFISTSTIGFGDFVPGSPLIAVMTSIYFLFGLALTSLCLGTVQEKMNAPVDKLTSHVAATLGVQLEDAEGAQSDAKAPAAAQASSEHAKAD